MTIEEIEAGHDGNEELRREQEAQELAEWAELGAIADPVATDRCRKCGNPCFILDMFCESCSADAAIAEANARIDYPLLVSITESSVYRVEIEPGFPTRDEIACVRMMKLIGNGREWNAGDGVEAYSVVQNRDGTYACDCPHFIFRLSKLADQRKAICKHADKMIEIGVFKESK